MAKKKIAKAMVMAALFLALGGSLLPVVSRGKTQAPGYSVCSDEDEFEKEHSTIGVE